MTIKKRLFWSNIMMLVIPVILSAIISYVILFVFTRNSSVDIERAFPQVFDVMRNFQKDGNEENLYSSIDNFNDSFADSGFFLAIIREDLYYYPEDALDTLKENEVLMRAVFEQGATGTFSRGLTRYTVEEVDGSRIVFVTNTSQQSPDLLRRPFLLHIPLIFFILMGAILLTNRLLTRSVTKRIMFSLNQLTDGAHQLGNGNLEYRIQYTRKDEFKPVCDAFDEMAYYLQRLIERQQKDEESRKELLAGISHDLRTPLTSIKAYVEGLLDGIAEDMPSQLRYLGIIRNKAEDIDKIVDKLFLFSKLDIGDFPMKLEKLDIGQELETMSLAVEEEYEAKGLSMVIEDKVQDLFVNADEVQLHNVFVNLLENSLRYKQKDTCTMKVRCFEDKTHVTIWMTDDGPGVEDDDLEKIFDVFYRGDPSRQNPSKGSGLGLAISSRIMKRIGGSIHAENAPEGGLRMVLRLLKYNPEGEQPDEKDTDH